MSQAALALLAGDDAADGEAPQTASQHAIALLEGRAQPIPEPVQRATSALRDPRTPRDFDPDQGVGVGETILHGASALAGTVVGGLHGVGSLILGHSPEEAAEGIKWYQQALTYEPRTQRGQQIAETAGGAMASPWNPLNIPGVVGEYAGEKAEEAGWGPLATTALRMAPEALAAAAGRPGTGASVASDLRSAGGAFRKGAEKAFDIYDSPMAAPGDPLRGFGADSASAAAASRINAAKSLSPELEADLRAQVQRGPLDAAAVDRQIDADALPVRMRLMEGQASKNPEVWSREFNAKGKDPAIASRFNEQNQQLIDNLDEFRRQAAPQAVAHDPIQSGQNIVDAYKTADSAAREQINAAYKVARDANGGDLPMDGPGFVASAETALKAENKARWLPTEIAAELEDYKAGMTFDQFENFRTTLANAARSADRAGNGNAARAVSLVRDAIESTEPVGVAKEVKPLFDNARSLAKARFDKIKADPAYKASVNDDAGVGESSALADKFVQKYIVGAPRAHVERLMGNLSGDELALETVRAAPFNYLKQKAGIDPYRNEGNFSQHGYNRALADLMPKMDLLAGEDLAEQAQRLGRVAYDVKGEPAGSFPNRSNTFIAASAEAAKGLAERSANTLIGGNIVPVGSWAREKLDARTVAREQKERMRPAAGTLAKGKKP